MSDTLIIALLAAGCFVLWLFIGRRKPAAQSAETPNTKPGTEPRPINLKCEAISTFSPAYHNKKGWPAFAIEMLPPAGNVGVQGVTFTEHVIATYNHNGETLTVEETVDGGDDIELVGLHDEVTEHSPHPRCKVVLAVHETILERTKAPEGYDPLPTCITVHIGMELTGMSS